MCLGRIDLMKKQFGVDLRRADQARTDETLQGAVEIGGNLLSEHQAGKDRAAALAMTDSHNAEMRELVAGLKPASTPTESPTYWKAQAMVPGDYSYTPKGGVPSRKPGASRGASGGTFLPRGTNLDSAFGQKSVVKSRMGANGMFSQGTNPKVSGARSRSTR